MKLRLILGGGSLSLILLFLLISPVRAADYQVINTNDSDGGSLRQAIINANNSNGSDTIVFNIPESDPGCLSYIDDGIPEQVDYNLGEVNCLSPEADPDIKWWRISLESSLPDISDLTGGLEVLGNTQTEFSENSNPWGLEIEIIGLYESKDKGTEENPSSLWRIISSQNRISQLVIRHPYSAGLMMLGKRATQNQIDGCYVGINVTGEQSFLNSFFGVGIILSPGQNIIGGDSSDLSNLISHSFRAGIFLLKTKNNLIQNNIIQNNGWIKKNLLVTGPFPFVYEGVRYEDLIMPSGESVGTQLITEVEGMPQMVTHDGTMVKNLEPETNFSLALVDDGSKHTFLVNTAAAATSQEFSTFLAEVAPSATVNCWVNDILINQGPEEDYLYVALEDWDRTECPGEVELITDYSEHETPYLNYQEAEDYAGAGLGLRDAINNKIYSNHIKNNGIGLILKGNSFNNEIGGLSQGNAIYGNEGNAIILEDEATYTNKIFRNSIYNNGLMGIDVGNDDSDITNMTLVDMDGSGEPIAKLPPPVFGVTRYDFESDAVKVFGTAQSGIQVDIYLDGSLSDNEFYTQGKEFLATVLTNEEGEFETELSDLQKGDRLTAIALDSQGRVSEFAERRTYDSAVRINLGEMEEDTLVIDGRLFLADREWDGTSFGYVGGEVKDVSSLAGHGHMADMAYYFTRLGMRYGMPYLGPQPWPTEWIAELYSTHISNFQEYYIKAPAGDYGLRLHFEENSLSEVYGHGADQRVFDIKIEDETVYEDLDLYKEAGRSYPLKVTLPVTISDGLLNLELVSHYGGEIPAKLDALEFFEIDLSGVLPPEPPIIDGLEGYLRNTIHWFRDNEPTILGYDVYRSSDPEVGFVKLNEVPVLTDYFNDDSAEAKIRYYYRAKAIDMSREESEFSEPVILAAVDITRSDLPIYEIEISEEALKILNDDVFANEYVEADFYHQGTKYEGVEVRYRGGFTREAHQMSWKIKFNRDQIFEGTDGMRRKINLHNLQDDYVKARHRIFYAYDNAYLNTTSRRGKHAVLLVNGEYAGLFLDIEQIDEYFLERNGLNEDGSIYKVHGGDLSDSAWSDSYNYEHENGLEPDFIDLREFIDLLNELPDEQIPVMIADRVNLASFMDFYASIIIFDMLDIIEANHYLYRDKDTNKWEMILADPGLFIMHDTGLDYGTSVNPEPYHDMFHGSGEGLTNMLFEKFLLTVPEFRYAHAQNIKRILEESYNIETMTAIINPIFDSIDDELRKDVHKLQRHSNEMDLGGGTMELIGRIEGSIQFLSTQIYPFMPQASELQDILYINEFYPDDSGQAWVEIYNAGHIKFDLGGMYLTNNSSNPEQWQFPSNTYLEAGEYLQVPFDVSSSDTYLGLFDVLPNGNEEFDSVTFSSVTPGYSFGRAPDALEDWQEFSQPTPGEINVLPTNHSPLIADVTYSPLTPQGDESVTIQALVTDEDGDLNQVMLYYDPGTGYEQVEMIQTSDDYYSATVQPSSIPENLVKFYIEAFDTESLTTVNPEYAPVLIHKIIFNIPQLYINELMSDNNLVLQDEAGEYNDWFEIYNPSEFEHVDLQNIYLSDKLDNPLKWKIEDFVSIPPQGYQLFWADEDQRQGLNHTNFKLSKNGEVITLYYAQGGVRVLLDMVEFPAMGSEVSYGRFPDGSGSWRIMTGRDISPGESNPWY